MLVSGVLAMVAGLAIVKTHNFWRADWTLLVTLFGWALLIGGVVRGVAPPLARLVMPRVPQRTALRGLRATVAGRA